MTPSRTLYALLPAYFRRRDAELGYPCRALFDVLEEDGADLIAADLDAFAAGLFVETAPEELLAEIGALIGAPTLRPVPMGSGTSLRAFLGNLLRYRRAKGTPAALEMLARDVTLYSAKAVEYYARLAATPTMRAPRLDRPATARMNDVDGLARHGTPFDRNPRTPDMRSIARAGGRYNIPNVGVHLWRLEAVPFEAPDADAADPGDLATTLPFLPWAPHPGHFALLPGGQASPLFMPQQNAEEGAPQAHQVPERLRRLPLKRDLDAIAEGRLEPSGSVWFGGEYAAFTLFLQYDGEANYRRIPPGQVRIGALTNPPYTQPAPVSGGLPSGIEACLDPATGRLVVRDTDVANGFPAITGARLAAAYGQPGALGGGAYDRNVRGDTQVPFRVPKENGPRILVVEPGAPDAGDRYSSLANALAAWKDPANAQRRGIIVITANMADQGIGNLTIELAAGCDLTIVAAEWRLPDDPTDPEAPQGFIVRKMRRMLLDRRVRVKTVAVPDTPPGALHLDGLLLLRGMEVEDGAARSITARHCTLLDGVTVPALRLPGTTGQVSLGLDRCIFGTIEAGSALTVIAARESILAPGAGIAAPQADLDLFRLTAFAPIAAKSATASDCMFSANVTLARTQSGCVRYSYLGGADNRLPRRFRCQPDLAWDAAKDAYAASTPAERSAALERMRLALRPSFLDPDPTGPGFALLTIDSPTEIRFGGENEAEMGAYGFLGGSTRIANLTDLFADFVPFGMEAGARSADRSSTEAARRNLP
ncbi:hypothetical protein MWN34_00320 [Ancylobacter sp. 6x-1]|uniref:Uncharacterized protein n=1 Tax=Ancylobacter crimeensis TaxID=2579147 RepID=A0ABT0D5Z6_9HYPH|nr:hypothetical protein [Ancylobacter crimeensis]MCK0195348.1 hypothetical protein [Ancylobacter crimeensis]